jgi:hypothetical protein
MGARHDKSSEGRTFPLISELRALPALIAAAPHAQKAVDYLNINKSPAGLCPSCA